MITFHDHIFNPLFVSIVNDKSNGATTSLGSYKAKIGLFVAR